MNPEVTTYIENIGSIWQRKIMIQLRQVVHGADKDIEEKIKWGSIAFDDHGPVLWAFTAQQWVHISFSHGSLLDSSHGLFENTTNKGQRTIKLHKNDNFPASDLTSLIKEAVSNNKAGKRISFAQTKATNRTFDLPKKYKNVLESQGVAEEFMKRPYYQQSGWIRWIESAKKDQTKERRIDQMVAEIKSGDLYMRQRTN